MSEMSREHLFAVVRDAYDAHDPVPDGLVERMQEIVVAEEAGLGLDLELMLLVEQSSALEGVRGGDLVTDPDTDSETDSDTELFDSPPFRVPDQRQPLTPARRAGAAPYTLRFVLGEVDLLVRVAPDGDGASARIDGWVVPPEAMTVRAVPDDRRRTSRATVVGESGRFEFTGLEPGLVRLQFEAHDGSRPPFATPTFEI